MSATTVKIVLNNTDKVRKSVTGDMLKDAARAGAEYVRGQARINANQKFSAKSRGNLSESIVVEPSELTETRAMFDIGPTVIYGRIQELGGIILPVFAKMLSWIGDDGQRIFAKMVKLPARPYLRPAMDEHMPEIENVLSTVLINQLEKAAKE